MRKKIDFGICGHLYKGICEEKLWKRTIITKDKVGKSYNEFVSDLKRFFEDCNDRSAHR